MMWRFYRIFVNGFSGQHQPGGGTQVRILSLSTNSSNSDDSKEASNIDYLNPDIFGTLEDESEILTSKTKPQTGSVFKNPRIKKAINDIKKNKVSHDIRYAAKGNSESASKDDVGGEFNLRNRNISLYEAAISELGPQSSSDKKQFTKHADVFGTLDPSFLGDSVYVGDEGEAKTEQYEARKSAHAKPLISYAKKIKALLKENKLRDALAVCEEEMRSDGVKPDSYCYGLLIDGCAKVGHSKKAFQLYNDMLRRQLRVKNMIYTSLFDSCANCPYPEKGLSGALRLREKLAEKQVILNEINYNSMIKAFGRCGRLDMALEVLDEMVRKKVKVSQTTLSFAFQACISDRETGFRHALMVWRKMRSMHISPTLFHFNLLLRCAHQCQAGDRQLLTELVTTAATLPTSRGDKKKSLLPSVQGQQRLVIERPSETNNISYKVEDLQEEEEDKFLAPVEETLTPPMLLAKEPSAGSLEHVTSLDNPIDRLAVLGGSAGFLAQMVQQGISPDLKTFTQLLSFFQKSSEDEEMLLQQMERFSLTPDTAFCNILIKQRNKRGDYEGAKDALSLMTSHHLSPDLITFGCLALGCRSLDEANELLQEMEKLGHRPNLAIMDCLTSKAIRGNRFFYALEMLRKMREYQLPPNEQLVRKLEGARKSARNHMLKMGNQSLPLTESEKSFYDCCKVFVLEYKKWLKNTKMEPKDQPWALAPTPVPPAPPAPSREVALGSS